MRADGRALIWTIQLASVAAMLAFWEAVARFGLVDPAFVPAPSAVVRGLRTVGATALGALGDTLAKTAVAYALAVAFGVVGGIVIGSVRTLRDVLGPYVI